MTLRSFLVAHGMALLLLPSGARAHDALQRSVPTKDAHLAVAPSTLRLTFTSAPGLAFVRIRLLGSDGAAVQLGPPRLDSARTVVLDITGALRAGVHTVAWQIAGADGHPVRGQYTFTIAPGAAGLDPHAGHATGAAPDAAAGVDTGAAAAAAAAAVHHDPATMPAGLDGFGVESPGYAAVRWVNLMALLAIIGAVAFRGAVLPLARRRMLPATYQDLISRAAPLTAAAGLIAAAALLLATVARVFAQSWAMHGAAQAFEAGLIRGMVAGTTWGRAWLGHAAAGALALAGFAVARAGKPVGWTLAAIAAVGAAATSALAGHAAATSWAPLTIAADMLHALGAAGWLGGLLMLVTVGMPAALRLEPVERSRVLADLVNAFSPTALACAGLAAVTGAVLAWSHLGSVGALWSSSYGRTLLLKLGALSVVALTGAYNWRRVRPTLARDAAAARRLRASASMELVVAVIVIAITAVLVATPPPAEMITP